MAATETMPGASPPVTEIERMLADHIRVFCEKCDSVIERGYRELIRGVPTQELLEQHRRDLHWALRSARLYHRLASGAEFADRSLAELLQVKLSQLEEHWKYIYEPPSEEETDKLEKLIQKVFPGEPGT